MKNKSQQAQVVGVSRGNWFHGRIFRQKTLQDLKQEIQPLLNQKSKGKVTLEFYISEYKNIRQLNQVSYRFLSFIFFSYLFYTKTLGYIKKMKLKIIIYLLIQNHLMMFFLQFGNY